jgi:DNA adenine methylase
MRGLGDATFICEDYRNVSFPDNSIVYCDPPYAGTTEYSNSSEFSHEDFWDYVRKISENNIVFVSEYGAPNDFVEIWSKNQVVKLDARKKENIFVNTDRLFIHKSLLDKYPDIADANKTCIL